MKCASILHFFDILNAVKSHGKPNVIKPKSISDYISQKPSPQGWGENGADPFETYKICKKFELEGLMVNAGRLRNGPVVGECFYSNLKYSQQLANYGCYEYIIYGFEKVREEFKGSVVPLIAEKDGDENIGSSFLFLDRYIVTARHCIENQDSIKLLIDNFNHMMIEDIFFHKNEDIDLAFILINKEYYKTLRLKSFLLGDYKILDDILVMGYPPIPGFDSVLVSETAQVGNVMNASKGEVVSSSQSYLSKSELILFNARAKGGNSGGPVVSKMGTVVGVVTDMPTNQGTEFFGYGAATPYRYINEMLEGSTAKVNIMAEKDKINIKQ